MAGKTYVLNGRALDPAALQALPEEARFSWKQVRDWTAAPAGALTTLLEDLSPTVGLVGTPGSGGGGKPRVSSRTPQCPVGPHPEPGLDVAVLRACGISPTQSVAVQCSQGHWVEYPCKRGRAK